MSYTYDYPRPSVTVDCVIFNQEETHVLAITRKNEPFQNCLALPGGFVNMDEKAVTAAYRELQEETGIEKSYINEYLRPFGYFDNPDRDPRGRVISFGFYSSLASEHMDKIKAADDAASYEWVRIADIMNDKVIMAFDHRIIVIQAEIERDFNNSI